AQRPLGRFGTLADNTALRICPSNRLVNLRQQCATRGLPRMNESTRTRAGEFPVSATEHHNPHQRDRRPACPTLRCVPYSVTKSAATAPAEGPSMTDDSAIQRTLVLLKPDAVARGLTGRVLTRFEDAMLKVVAVKMVWMDAEQTRRHYFDLEQRFG